MSSVLASPAQIPSRSGYFKVSAPVTTTFFYPEPLLAQLTVGANGITAITGNEITVNTYANATTLLTNGSTPFVGSALVAGQFYRDMGKTWHIIVGGLRVATITKVQRYGQTGGEATEGVIGISANTLPATAGNQYTTGYVVTWSANPTTIPIAVSRTGY